jgi:hypothetical protein
MSTKKQLTEKSIQTYYDYLVKILIAFGYNRYREYFEYAINGAKTTYSAADVKRLRSELKHRIEDDYGVYLMIL